MFDLLDFNDNGQIDPAELFVGASIASSFGYGAGLAESEHRKRMVVSDLEDELDRRQRRIEELEDELDELRSGYGAYDDDDWRENGWEGDGYDDELYVYGYDGIDEDDEDDEYVSPGVKKSDLFEVIVREITRGKRQRAWADGLDKKYPVITCRLEDGDLDGPHGIGVYVNGELGGYLPPNTYSEVSSAFCGKESTNAFDYDAELKVDESGKCVGVECVWLTLLL